MQYPDFCDNDERLENDSTRTISKKSDRYQGQGMSLVEESAVTSHHCAKTLTVNEREEYAKAFQEFNGLFQNRQTKHGEILTAFVDPIRPKDVKLKKGKCRSLSLLEALEEEEAKKNNDDDEQNLLNKPN